MQEQPQATESNFTSGVMDQEFSFLKPQVSIGSSIWNFNQGLSKNPLIENQTIPLQFIEEVGEGEEEQQQPLEVNNNHIDNQYNLEVEDYAYQVNHHGKRGREYSEDEDVEEEEMEDFDEEEEVTKRKKKGAKHVDITEYLCLPQSDAAIKLGLPVSTLSKRWKEAAKNRKWPFRRVAKIDKEISQLLQGVQNSGPNAGVLSEALENQLSHLLKQRQTELRRVVIRL